MGWCRMCNYYTNKRFIVVLFLINILLNIDITVSKRSDDTTARKHTSATALKPSEVTLKCLVCKELIWVTSINTDFQFTQDPKSVTEINLVNLLNNACQYPTWTLDYEFKYDVYKSKFNL